ncbi:tumor necrosis factor receptor superfamily member 27 isoform X1, partial [Tachysurus ichikawai]
LTAASLPVERSTLFSDITSCGVITQVTGSHHSGSGRAAHGPVECTEREILHGHKRTLMSEVWFVTENTSLSLQGERLHPELSQQEHLPGPDSTANTANTANPKTERDQSGGTDEMEQRMVKTFTSSHQELQINSPEPLPLSKHLSHRFSCAAVEQHPRSNPGVPEPSDCPAGLGRRKKKLRRVEQSSLESLPRPCTGPSSDFTPPVLQLLLWEKSLHREHSLTQRTVQES